MKKPTKALLLLGKNQYYKIRVIHFNTGLITLEEKENVYNTVSIKNIVFDFSDFTENEKETFLMSFSS